MATEITFGELILQRHNSPGLGGELEYIFPVRPVIAVCFFPAGFATLSTIGPADSRNIAVPSAVPAANVFGGGAIPIFIGYLGDAASFSVGIVLVVGLITLGAALAYFL